MVRIYHSWFGYEASGILDFVRKFIKCNINISRRRSQGIVSESYNWTQFPIDKRSYRSLNLYNTILTLTPAKKMKKKKSFKIIVEKGENAVNQHFLLFPQCYLLISKQTLVFECRYCIVCSYFQFD